ncbi:MAG: hypothetical protein LBL58_19595, partial [Tannerellaceae bacterium]|nr:hypothetical protein [Tannerellaceae bacterium]
MRTISSSFPLLREAKVINTTDPEELGRIQLKIYPELAEIPDADCPWAFPATGGIHGKSFGVPLKNQLISCFCWSKYWNEFSFLPFNITKPTEHLFDDFMKNVRPLMKDVPTDPEEEHLIVERYEDDFSEFHDAKNRQHGWVHPSGAHATINDLGDIFLWLIKLLTVHNGDDTIILKVNPEDKSVKFYQTGKLESETDDSVNIKIHKTYDLKVDGNVTNKFNAEETTEVIGNSSHKSANTDIESTAPVGIKGTGTLLGAGVLQPYWADETAAWTQYPVIIPPVPWPPGMGMSRKLVTSRTPHAFAPVSLKRYANAALRKLSEQVFQTF